MTTSITRDQLRFAIDDGSVIVVDALPAAPYSRRHIPGALNLVIDDVDEQAPRLLPEKGASIVTYSTDAGCDRGEALAERLEQLGYADVRRLPRRHRGLGGRGTSRRDGDSLMSDTRAASETPAAPATRWRALYITLWVLQALLAFQFAMAGFLKISGDPAMVEMFATIGAGQWFRYVVGALELAGAVGVLIPRLSGLAALGLLCLMVGASVTNVFVLGTNPLLPIGLLLVSALVAWGRWPQIRALAGRLKG